MFAKIISGLKTFGLIVGVLITSVGILFGAFKFIEKGNKSATSVEMLDSLVVTSFDNMNIRLNKIDNNILDLKEQLEENHQSVTTLQKSYINFVRKSTQNSDELYNILKDFIDVEKKSEVKPEVFVTPLPTNFPNFTLLSKK